jgi:DNA-3-methyladenine glycosylase II
VARHSYLDGSAFDAADVHLAMVDPVLAELVQRLGPIREHPEAMTSDRFAALILAIVRQQLSTAVADAIYQRFLQFFGGHVPTPRQVVEAGDALRPTAGLSHAKDRTIRALAAEVAAGTLDLNGLPDLPDDEAMRRLTAVTGIGPWTAGVFLMFGLHRPDVLVAGDLGIRKAVQLAYDQPELPRPAIIESLAEAWRPYRTRGCFYLWASVGAPPP